MVKFTEATKEQAEKAQSCRTCSFESGGVCRRYPPQISGTPRVSLQPTVLESTWCAEWTAVQ
jgi:hypothetical protein